MKKVFAKPILLSMSFNAIYFGLTTSFVIQAIRVSIDKIYNMQDLIENFLPNIC